MNNIRTVSDTKRAFYNIHTRPINSIYRRVVEELMVEMHLLSVNVDFKYDPIYALGVVTAFDRFMQGYIPEADKLSIWAALIMAQESDPNQYRADATALEAQAATLSVKDLTERAKIAQESSGDDPLQSCFHAIANNPKFKYSRLFAIGLYTLLEKSDVTAAQDSEGLKTILSDFSEALRLPKDKLEKDLDLYRTNLEKVAQARLMVEEMTQAERKKREQRAAQSQTATSGSKNPSKDDQVSDS
ncbi:MULTISPECIES: photosystem II biogenesis protein Psp29 [Limnospira]|nr:MULTISPECIES: photosystem II biogenesis protein Psp29 [Limnospira]MDC0838299.1 photosystem II biogenesis protein Psp29 [Limnoraphis robusta]MDY7053348.1 photosystem II biogenesis protein Psp29 [Limnospira fusiformis LS22]MDT9190483.1 photosystem II biogenesis protein Psp29 [Limnospira sp. PMC 894.15]MDT9236478.1 photosystem II biogenesis protein Psp29 [Limnospira sp. PMC 917.15]MDT9274830.1 photosystem II biogenesis protein Psp29 [Limnospira sp. PMC 737.11]